MRGLHRRAVARTTALGVKLILSETPVGKLPIPVTLGVIVATIGVSIAWSLRATRATTAVSGQPGTGKQ